MEEERKISSAVIKRLPRYYRYLGYLIDKDIKKASSKELATIMSITASQVRQDLNNFGCFGQQGYGYDIHSLYLEIKKILGIDYEHNMVLIGFGNIGQALANYTSFEERGFKIIAIFDNNPNVIGMVVKNKTVYSSDYLPNFLNNNEIDIVIIAVPKNNALKVVDTLKNHKIRGIWNFSNVEIELSNEDILVENIHLSDSLMTLSYKINKKMDSENIKDIDV